MFSRKRFTRIFVFMLITVLLTQVFLVSAQDDVDRSTRGGRFVVADANSNVSLDPFVTAWHSWAHYAIFATLFSRDENFNYIGYLADTWEVGADGTALTIHLIKDAMFTDGTPVDGAAIKWNLERYANPDTGAAQGADLIGLLTGVDVDATDPYTITLNLASSYAPLFYTLSGIEIVSPTAYEAEGVDNFGTHPVGSGPFKLKELNTNNYILLERNDDFHWAPPELATNPGPVYLDEMQITFLGEDQTILAALETGELTYAGIPPQNLADIETNTDINVQKGLDTGLTYVGFNTSKDPWSNKELRQAFAYATDKQEVVTIALNDLAEPVYQPLPPSIWGHNPDLDADAIHFDPDKAASMLDELGYKDVDGDGVREDATGAPWVVPIAVQNDDTNVHVAEVIEAQWSSIGIPVRLDVMERTALIDLTTTGTHDLFLLGYGYQDPSILSYFFEEDRKGGSNRVWFSSDELSALLTKADTDLNQDTRFQTITEISKYVMDQAMWDYLYDAQVLVGIRNEYKGWKFMPDLSLNYYDSYFETGS